jgi:cytoskeletal protein RodZ
MSSDDVPSGDGALFVRLEGREKMANPSGGQSRLFMIVVVGLVGLLMLGLVAIAGLVVYTRFLAPAASPTVVAEVTPSRVPTVAPTSTTPSTAAATSTPEQEAPTATRVLQEGTPEPEGETPVAGTTPTATPEGEGELAPTGFGPLEALVGGVALVLIILLVRGLRMSSRTS